MQKVSICIPVFNGGPYLSDALHSAAAQSYEDIEILISDNGSTDDSPDIIEQFVRNCGRPARRVRGALPGMVQNWNHLGFSAQGAWIKYLFHDDMLQPNCVERMVAAANRDPRVALVFSRRHVAASGDSSDPLFQQLVRDLEQLHSISYPFRRDGGWYLGRRDLLWHRTTNFIGEPTSVLMSRSAFLAANGFSLRLRQLVDYEMWLRLMTMGKVVFVDEALATFRVHASQMSMSNLRDTENARRAERRCFMESLTGPLLFGRLHPRVQSELRREVGALHDPWPLPRARLQELLWNATAYSLRFIRRRRSA
ncbi:glycosyltransferase family 2 protein [Gemmatimonas sp.]|jgi:glycosyltransferase involved in cell wall biosynthesis|uniref:glycosyltransferase family 2 protein n=1 Tax=Gemmatimonas sp. TaxID=1962908 RepID=UPI0037C11982